MNTEQYNLYIEADEEVTTIISRLHVAHHENVALIVPQHSLLLQSIINLRLLAREAKKQQKNIIIVTQDDEGSVFAKKIGIPTIPLSQWQEDARTRESVQQSIVQESKAISTSTEQIPPSQPVEYVQDESHYSVKEDHVEDETGELVTRSYQEQIHRKKRPVGMDISPSHRPNATQKPTLKQETQVEIITPIQEISPPQEEHALVQETFPVQEKKDQSNPARTLSDPSPIDHQQTQFTLRPSKDKKFAKKSIGSKELEKSESAKVSDSPKKIHAFGWLLAFFSAAFVFGFLVLPYSVVNVTLSESALEESLSLTSKTSFTEVDVQRRMIPLRKIEKEIVRTIAAPATGKEDVQAGKAYGTLKIYNTFSQQPQALVATTRFESPQGQIFRLVKGTTVPGATQKDGVVEPGVVEVSVEADKAGEIGEISSVKWTIPGFANNKEKFSGFYAQNEQPMTDGNAAGKDATVVTVGDIKKLEESSTEGLPEYIAQQLSELLRETETLLPEAISYDITRSQSTVTPGTVAKEAQFVINAQVTAFVFDGQSIDQIADETFFAQRNIDRQSIESTISFEDVNIDTTDEKISFTAILSILSDTEFDQEKFKDQMKGKNQEEIREILENDYPFVSEISLKSYPPFLGSKFSRYSWMTSIKDEVLTEL